VYIYSNEYRILNLVHDVDKSEKEILQCCAQHLKRLAQFNSAAEVLEKLGDIKALVALHIETQQWHYVSKNCLHM
jgi:intraflagellar transport protein 122